MTFLSRSLLTFVTVLMLGFSAFTGSLARELDDNGRGQIQVRSVDAPSLDTEVKNQRVIF